jgi:DNA-3-methyladenine glycosylase
LPIASDTIRGVSPSSRLRREFYTGPTLTVARALLGQQLVRLEDSGNRLAGLIIECEAYVGVEDLGCHARSGRTARNASMWGPPGHAYVYFTYGIHWMLNVVTEPEGRPAAVLIRGLWPQEGKHIMLGRRPRGAQLGVANGPAKLCQALAIDKQFDGQDLCAPSAQLFLEEGRTVPESHVTVGPRVGLNTVPEPWKSIPWRFRFDPRSCEPLFEEEMQS